MDLMTLDSPSEGFRIKKGRALLYLVRYPYMQGKSSVKKVNMENAVFLPPGGTYCFSKQVFWVINEPPRSSQGKKQANLCARKNLSEKGSGPFVFNHGVQHR
jgi:hypothetical protein